MVGMVEWYDPQANRCDSIASLSTPRCNFAAAALGDSLFIMGGYRSLTVSDGDVVLRDVELLRPSARWNGSSTELPVSLHSAQAISIQGRIYCVGGVVGTTTTRRVLVFYP
jgi:N-acetylneuraminic acid mutarotase